MQQRRTKIIATMGPAIDDPAILSQMIQSGVNCFRLNFSHGSAKEHEDRAKHIKICADALNQPTAILADLQGPKIRIGDLQFDCIALKEGASITLETTPIGAPGDQNRIEVVGYPAMANDVKPQNILLLDDGYIKLRVQRVEGTSIQCQILHDATLRPHKGVNLQGGGISAPAFTDKDREDLKTALKIGADYIALSFVRNSADITEVKALIKEAGSHAQVIAKIERCEAVEAIDEILDAADGIMVARGDLAIEVGEAEVPAIQKQLLFSALAHAKISIVATQMMESMIENPNPTRAEISDVANAVLDGSDAVMLSAETAVGKHPIKVIQTMHQACISVEKYPYLSDKRSLFKKKMQGIDEAIAMAAIYTANRLAIKAIITLTESGTTAQRMSRIYSGIPIYALSRDPATLRRVVLYRNVTPLYFDVTAHKNHLYRDILCCAREANIAKAGDTLLVTHGAHLGIAGKTNTLKILQMKQKELTT